MSRNKKPFHLKTCLLINFSFDSVFIPLLDEIIDRLLALEEQPVVAQRSNMSLWCLQNFSRTDRLLRHRRLCTVGMSKDDNQYSDTSAHTASWSPLQPSNNRLTV